MNDNENQDSYFSKWDHYMAITTLNSDDKAQLTLLFNKEETDEFQLTDLPTEIDGILINWLLI